MALNWKNPIIFGVIIGIVLCLFLFIHDKLFRKKEEKNGFSVYLKLFIAGFCASAPLVWLFFNRDLRFSTTPGISPELSTTTSIELKGGSIEIEELKNNVVPDAKIAQLSSVEKIKSSKRCHADMPDW